MKTNPLIPTALLGLLVLGACEDSVQAGSGESKTSSSERGKYSYEERESFRADMERAIDKLDARLVELKAKASEAGQELKADTQDLIDDIEAKLPELRQKLAELRGVTREGWEDFSRKFHDGIDELVRRIDRAFG